MKSIEQVLTEELAKLPEDSLIPDPRPLIAALYEREDVKADIIRLAAAQFGMYPEIVAEVITNAAELGTPVSDQEHLNIRLNFNALMERLAEEQGR